MLYNIMLAIFIHKLYTIIVRVCVILLIYYFLCILSNHALMAEFNKLIACRQFYKKGVITQSLLPGVL